MSEYNVDKIRELALEYLEYFVPLERESGINTYIKQGDYPEELQKLCMDAHNNMIPDDYKYNFIVDSLNLIADSDIEELEELSYEIKADIYNRDLVQWLSSNLERGDYITQYVQEFYSEISTNDFDIYNLISLGQVMEKQEVFNLVLQSLISITKNLEDALDNE